MEPILNKNQISVTPVPAGKYSLIVRESQINKTETNTTADIEPIIMDIKRLKPAEEAFCQLYANSSEYFNNATLSYAVAYNYNLDDILDKDEYQTKYNSARVLGSKILTKVYIRERVSQILRENLTNDKIDEELSWVAKQRKDLGAKMRAINEHNKLKGRIEEKMKHTFDEESLLSPAQIYQLLENRKASTTEITEVPAKKEI